MADTKQPRWRLVANLGDTTPLEYGGYFVYRDATGVYPPEAELLREPEDGNALDDPAARWTVYRFILEPCTFVDGVLSDNPFHPGHAVWFADSLVGLASFTGQTELELITAFCSDDARVRADAWRTVGDYHGYENLDSYPIELTRAEVKRRYRRHV